MYTCSQHAENVNLFSARENKASGQQKCNLNLKDK
jgi:hypothetical protein